jgi:hypothetical protein
MHGRAQLAEALVARLSLRVACRAPAKHSPPPSTMLCTAQDAALRVLRSTCTATANKLSAAAAAVGRLGHYDLAMGAPDRGRGG